jgi:hypothetical protein
MKLLRTAECGILVAAVLLLGFRAKVVAAPFRVNTIGLFGPDLVDGFEDLSVGEVPGILVRNGFSVGESFAGQDVSGGEGTSFEAIVGSPSGPLRLNVPVSGDGIMVLETIQPNIRLAGMANGTGNDDVGEGALAFLFDMPARAFALSFSSDQADTIQLAAYDSDGHLIDLLIVPRSVRPISFISDTAAVKGFSITNTDLGGITVDFLQLISVPEPTAITFAVLAGICMASLRGYGVRR